MDFIHAVKFIRKVEKIVKNKLFRRLISLLLVLAMIMPTLSAVYAQDNTDSVDESESDDGEVKETSAQIIDELTRAYTYSTYYTTHKDDPRPDAEVIINGVDFKAGSYNYYGYGYSYGYGVKEQKSALAEQQSANTPTT